MSWNNENNVVKSQGKCWDRRKHKYCSYWRSRRSEETKKTVNFYCSLYRKEKIGYDSLPECNVKYGKTYDGKK